MEGRLNLRDTAMLLELMVTIGKARPGAARKLGRAEFEALKLDKFRRLVRHVREPSPYYRRRPAGEPALAQVSAHRRQESGVNGPRAPFERVEAVVDLVHRRTSDRQPVLSVRRWRPAHCCQISFMTEGRGAELF